MDNHKPNVESWAIDTVLDDLKLDMEKKHWGKMTYTNTTSHHMNKICLRRCCACVLSVLLVQMKYFATFY